MAFHNDSPDRPQRPARARRSVLYLPASNSRAMEKAAGLACDALIFDLEDAVGPDDREAAREALLKWFTDGPSVAGERVIRINALTSQWGPDDLQAAIICQPMRCFCPRWSAWPISSKQRRFSPLTDRMSGCGQ